MLKELAIITITVTNLTQVETAWKDHFSYQVKDQGTISSEMSAYLSASETEGQDYIIMQPKNDAPVYVRFIEDETVYDYTPMTSYGWNATELLVSNPDTLASGMDTEDSLFKVVGAPKDLWPAPNAPRAMQVIGPGGELLYLTRNQQAAGALGLDESMPLAERPFIMVLGGPSMSELTEFYGGTLELLVDPPSFFKISMISKANNLDPETTYPLSIAYAAPGYLIEMDELPEITGPRVVAKGHLPPGVAIVGFNSDGINEEVEWVSELQKREEFPYNGRTAGIFRGPAGELIEVILTN
ncbi:MAG: hypothetical protein GY727_03880 [Gammaproteobacteria bacterium]|nr:hypothetical protein [Gammaproteobacteria bacterium]MCP4090507.1 hypothetical protein [Gammaproteobacteria bacterium]MCP4276628.1 hypothetical protein [Gammaproteobacteria bacterium]MCP4831378.1 hypothetical protein [Gammaproteobacteria bacterium]MCP4927922.1 hypothetical protein [Gammaproteobacteria bacterium]